MWVRPRRMSGTKPDQQQQNSELIHQKHENKEQDVPEDAVVENTQNTQNGQDSDAAQENELLKKKTLESIAHTTGTSYRSEFNTSQSTFRLRVCKMCFLSLYGLA